MQKIKQICRCGTEPLDGRAVERLDRLDHMFLGVAAKTGIEKISEDHLIGSIFVDVRDSQLWLPHERMVRALEDLPLLRNRIQDGLERRSPVGISERIGSNFRDYLLKSAPDRPEVLDARVPQKPRPVCPRLIIPRSEEHTSELQSR